MKLVDAKTFLTSYGRKLNLVGIVDIIVLLNRREGERDEQTDHCI
jgi:hypothetical protein